MPKVEIVCVEGNGSDRSAPNALSHGTRDVGGMVLRLRDSGA